MSVYTDFVQVMLQVNDTVKSPSGAQRDNWIDVQKVDAAIYKNDAFKSVQSTKFDKSTHNGLTFHKDYDLKKEYRFVIGMSQYLITDINTQGRFTTLLMQEINMYGK